MRSNLFRKESIDRLKSPEQLNQYIRVARPGIWLLLAASVLILAGMIIWAVFGTVETVVRVGVQVENGNAVCYVSEHTSMRLEPGMPVVIQEQAGTIAEIRADVIEVNRENLNLFLIEASELDSDSFCRIVEIDISNIEDGLYTELTRR